MLIRTSLRAFICSRVFPVPSATQERASSATETGKPAGEAPAAFEIPSDLGLADLEPLEAGDAAKAGDGGSSAGSRARITQRTLWSAATKKSIKAAMTSVISGIP